ncbi:hypothetical protein Vadar_015081 [Vaccinium darrowii]|uniref:Uncharacterized protein n=1 Tax=Vaccinium darrowii TaxID=229202 RepID=A0ACB7X0R5_9ERIC|nr:hypothetical protein Vadar_015081 [Vaccinium darrowii]
MWCGSLSFNSVQNHLLAVQMIYYLFFWRTRSLSLPVIEQVKEHQRLRVTRIDDTCLRYSLLLTSFSRYTRSSSSSNQAGQGSDTPQQDFH